MTLFDGEPPDDDDDGLPELPYRGTSGWSGSDTSYERAVNDDDAGVTRARQVTALHVLAERGDKGVTWTELAALCDWHHGQASGVLSVLHKEHRIARLVERRNRCKVYVHVEHVNGRATEEQGVKVDYAGRVQAALTLSEEHRAFERLFGHVCDCLACQMTAVLQGRT